MISTDATQRVLKTMEGLTPSQQERVADFARDLAEKDLIKGITAARLAELGKDIPAEVFDDMEKAIEEAFGQVEPMDHFE